MSGNQWLPRKEQNMKHYSTIRNVKLCSGPNSKSATGGCASSTHNKPQAELKSALGSLLCRGARQNQKGIFSASASNGMILTVEKLKKIVSQSRTHAGLLYLAHQSFLWSLGWLTELHKKQVTSNVKRLKNEKHYVSDCLCKLKVKKIGKLRSGSSSRLWISHEEHRWTESQDQSPRLSDLYTGPSHTSLRSQ